MTHVDLEIPDFLPNVRSSSYYIAASSRACWRCTRTSRVHGFILPPGLETLYEADEPEHDCWESSDAPSLVFYIRHLPMPVQARMTATSAHYRITYSETTQSSYWMNLCEHCGAKLGDHETFCEFGQGFEPSSAHDAAGIKLSRIDEHFAAVVGGYSVGIEFFDAMTRD